MSGGHFNYDQYKMDYIADEIEDLIVHNGSDEKDEWGYNRHSEYSPETIEEFKKAVYYLRMAKLYAHRIDWLVSGDDSEDSFHQRLKVGKELIGDGVYSNG